MFIVVYFFFFFFGQEKWKLLPAFLKVSKCFYTPVQHNRFLYLNVDLDPIAIIYIGVLYLYDKKEYIQFIQLGTPWTCHQLM